MNIKLVAEKTFNLLKGFGYEVSSYNKEGDLVIDPMEATRFAVESPNILVRIDPLDKHLSLKTGTPGEAIEKIRPMLKELAQDYLLDFDYSVFDKQIKPKGERVDVARKSKEDEPMSEEMEILRKLAGLNENPDLLDPPGAKLKFGQDKGQKLDFKTMDTIEFFATISNALKAGKLINYENKPIQKLDKDTLAVAFDFHRRGEQDPISAYAQASAQQQMGYRTGDFSEGVTTINGLLVHDDGQPLSKADWDSNRRREPGAEDYTAQEVEDGYQTYLDRVKKNVPAKVKEKVSEASLGKMTGSRKSSYQPLADSVKIIVRHNKDVNEEVRGARSRNIHSILIQRGEEKFKMAENNLSAARAMARHLHNGGETYDEIGEAITDMAKEFSKLKEFVGYVRRSKLVNEENEEFVSLAIENINNIRTTFKRLSGVKSYATAVESVKDYNNVELLQDDLDLESKFTETHFDDKVANAMDSLKAMTSRKRSFESKITKAIELESFAGLKDMLAEDDLLEFEGINQQLGHKVTALGNTAKDETLGNYLHSISNKLNAGGQLSQFEYGAIKSCLLSAGQHNVSNAPMSIEESYEAFMDRFDV
jgi:hypothetical protein